MRRAVKIAVRILALLLVLLLAGLVAIQSPKVQTAIGKKLIASIQEGTDAEISLGNISIRPLEAILVENVLVLDRAPRTPGMDTLLYVDNLSVKFSLRGLLRGKGAYVSRMRLHGGGFNLVMEPSSARPGQTVTNLERIFRLESGSGGESAYEWGNILSAKELEIKNVGFKMVNLPWLDSAVEEGVIDWNNLKTVLDEGHFYNLRIADNLICAQNVKLSLTETETGFHGREVSVRSVRVGEGLVYLEDLQVDDGFSFVNMAHFAMEGPIDDYSYFIDRIVLDGDIREGSWLDMAGTLSHFAGLRDIRFRGFLKGKIRGTVNNLSLENIQVEDMDNELRIVTGGRIRDIADVENSRFSMDIREASFDLDGLGRFIQAWSPATRLDLSRFAPGERLSFAGRMEGPLNGLNINGELSSGMGNILADIYLNNVLDQRQDMALGGELITTDLHLGKVLGVDALGPLSMRTRLDAVFRDRGGMDVKVDTLNVSRLQALGYDYSGISARFSYLGEHLDGHLVSADPNLRFHFDGEADLGEQEKQALRLNMDMQHADLAALHLVSREKAALSFRIESEMKREQDDKLDGEAWLKDLSLTSAEGVRKPGDLRLITRLEGNTHKMEADSPFLSARFEGSESILRFIKDIKERVVSTELPALTGAHVEQPSPTSPRYKLELNILQAQDILTFLKPGLYVENKTSARISIGEDGQLNSSLNSGRLALYKRYIKDLRLDLDNKGSAVTASLTGGILELGDMQLKGNRLHIKADDNHIDLDYSFDNRDDGERKGSFNARMDLLREDNALAVQGRVLPSAFTINGRRWELNSGDIRYRKGNVSVEQLSVQHGRQSIRIDGGLSAERTDTLHVNMNQFDLALLNNVTGGVPRLSGSSTGHATLISPLKPTPGLIAAIRADSTYISGKPVGVLDINSSWDAESGRYLASVSNALDGRRTLQADAFLNPATDEVGVRALLDKTDLQYAEPFLAGLFSEFKGELSGEASLGGKFGDLRASSRDLRIQNGRMVLDFTQVPYRFSGNLDLDNKGLHFKPLTLEDGQNGSGQARGSFLFNDFKNFGVDVHVDFDRMHVLNTAPSPESSFYGNLYGRGKVNVTGTLSSQLLLDIEATTQSGDIHIPLGSASSEKSRAFLSFKDPSTLMEQDPYTLMISRPKEQKQEMDLIVQLRVHATPQVQAYIDVDNESSLTGTGQGTINIESRARQGTFALTGDYTLSSGNFHFSAMNLVSRDFEIQDGSSVRFNGDVMNTDLNVSGLYVTKASLYNLTADESATSRRTVNCGIHITGKLRNPELGFSVNIPDLNPTVQAQVEAAFNTEDKIQKQFIYLLVAGNFLPSEESGISVGGGDVLFSNVSSIMSGQLNNIFQKLNIPLDLGLNYKTTQAGGNLFDVALSTQLFNNRVIVNGTVGNRQMLSGLTTNEVAGDINIEVKLNRSGSLRLKGFSRSADQLSAFLDNSQRHGGGFSYQLDFYTFKDLFRELFSSPAAREQHAREAALNPVKNVVLQIDPEGNAHREESR